MILKADQLSNLLTPNQERKSDPFVVTPCPSLEKLRSSGSASIDLRLGCWFLTLRQSKTAVLKILEEDQVWNESQFAKTQYVQFGHEFILHPQNFVLAVTLEWIRLPRDLAGYVIGRSSWGRLGLNIATAAGVHPGFTGCLTLEVSNLGEVPIAIKPGVAICQLFVHKVDTTAPDVVDQSRFIGSRKPKLGKIELDDVAKKLVKSHTL